MKATTQLDEQQRVCSLCFDELKIRECYTYDKASDTLFKPVKYGQVAILRGIKNYIIKVTYLLIIFFAYTLFILGLLSKWKQPVFYDFDCKMTVNIIFDIIKYKHFLLCRSSYKYLYSYLVFNIYQHLNY